MDPQEAKIYTAVLIVVAILTILIGYFIVSIISHQRRALRLHKEKIQAEILTLENERKRMASDLHDELGPVLSAVKMQISSIEVTEEDEEVIGKTSEHIDSMLQRIREISNNLMPTTLVRKGLYDATRSFTDQVNQAGKINIVYTEHADLPKLPAEKEVHMYRVVQEIMHNAIKHSKATEIRVDYSYKNNCLSLVITDNGVGFNQAEVSRNSIGHGLGNILSRVEILHGDLYVETKPGKGVKYNIEIPVNG